MKPRIYLLTRLEDVDYDEYEGKVIVATDEDRIALTLTCHDDLLAALKGYRDAFREHENNPDFWDSLRRADEIGRKLIAKAEPQGSQS